MKLVFALALAVATAAAAPSRSQPVPDVDPVKGAYRDYVGARDRRDVAAAEAAATRAWQASETRDGEGGLTAILALNTATARLDADRPADAITPAQRAVALAGRGAKGVDLLMTRLTLGEAQLRADQKADERPLVATLRDAEGRSDLDEAAYSAAEALEKAALTTRHFDNAAAAWLAIAAHPKGAQGEVNLIRGHALTQAAIVLIATHKYKEAARAVNEAGALLIPFAPEETKPETISLGELYFAEARAATLALRAVRGDRASDVEDTAFWAKLHRAELAGRPPVCEGQLKSIPAIEYPSRSLAIGEVGAVTLRVQTDTTGKVIGVRALSTTIAEDFRKAVEREQLVWSFSPDPKRSAPDCRLDSNDRLVGVMFRF